MEIWLKRRLAVRGCLAGVEVAEVEEKPQSDREASQTQSDREASQTQSAVKHLKLKENVRYFSPKENVK